MTEKKPPVPTVTCTICYRKKAPRGRSIPLALAGVMCDSDCAGFYRPPEPDCRWPGETVCGPGCTKETR